MNTDFDLSYLNKATKGKQDTINSIINIFSKESPAYLNLADHHLRSKQWKELQQVIHKLKNSVALFGVQPLYERISLCQNLCSQAEPPEGAIAELLEEITAPVMTLIAQLHKRTLKTD